MSPAADAAATRVTGSVEFDSRTVTPGGLFLALPGARSDGHDLRRGSGGGRCGRGARRPAGRRARDRRAPERRGTAAASVLEHDTDGSGAAVLAALGKLAAAVADELAQGGLTVIGITGSSGKTSTKDLVAAVLTPLGEVVAPPGSFNNELGHPWTVLRAGVDTDYLVLEMSARDPGNIAALRRSPRPRSRSCSTSGPPTSASSARARPSRPPKPNWRKLFRPQGVAVLNADDRCRRGDGGTDRRPGGAGRAVPGADVWAGQVALDEVARPRFTLHAAGIESEVPLAVHGDHQVSNALCAAAVALECGATGAQVATALAAAGPVSRHRMHVTTRDDGVTVIDDAYNANPDSMRAGVKALAGWPESAGPRRSWAVLGEMAELGEDAISEHDRVGRLAVRLDVTRLVVVGTGRPMSAMHHGAVMEGHGGESIMVADADAALELLRAELRRGTWCWSRRRTSAGLGRSPRRWSRR